MRYTWILMLALFQLLLVAESNDRDEKETSHDLDASNSFGKVRKERSRVYDRGLEVVRRYWNGNGEDDSEETDEENTPTSQPDTEKNVFKHYVPPKKGVIKRDTSPGNSKGPTGELPGCEESEFEQLVVIRLDNMPYDDFSRDDIYDRLETRFDLAYSITECGERKLDAVTVVNESQLASGDGGGPGNTGRQGNTYEYDIRVQGRSRTSPSNVRLFGGDTAGRRLGLAEDTLYGFRSLRKASSRTLQEDTCILCDPPSKEEFLDEYVETLRGTCAVCTPDGGPWESVAATGQLVELEPVDCPGSKTSFGTRVQLTLSARSNPTDEEREELENQFVEAYNLANARNGEICDLLFREVTNVELMQVEENVYEAIVNGSCRGCSENTGLFDGSNRRQLSVGSSKEDFLHSKQRNARRQEEDECFCPVGDPEERGPSEDEFIAAYNEIAPFTIVDVSDA